MQVFKKDSELTPCRFKEGFYVVPSYNRFSINRDGKVYDRKFQVFPREYPHKSGSGKYYIHTVNGLAIHRLMGDTFLDDSHLRNPVLLNESLSGDTYLPKTEALVVNHLDGNTENNKASNLEWVTHKENSIHAYSTGLRTDNIPLLCKDLRTNEVIRFFSYWDCARHFNINGGNVFHYLKSKLKNKIFMKHYLLIKEGESWPEVSENYAEEYKSGDSKITVVVSKILKQIHIFPSVSEAAKFTNIRPETLMKRLKACANKKQDFIEDENYKIARIDNFLKVMEEGLEEIKHNKEKRVLPNNFKIRQPKRIKVLDLNDFVNTEWESAEKFAESINTTKNTLQKHINRHNGVFHDRYKITYLS